MASCPASLSATIISARRPWPQPVPNNPSRAVVRALHRQTATIAWGKRRERLLVPVAVDLPGVRPADRHQHADRRHAGGELLRQPAGPFQEPGLQGDGHPHRFLGGAGLEERQLLQHPHVRPRPSGRLRPGQPADRRHRRRDRERLERPEQPAARACRRGRGAAPAGRLRPARAAFVAALRGTQAALDRGRQPVRPACLSRRGGLGPRRRGDLGGECRGRLRRRQQRRRQTELRRQHFFPARVFPAGAPRTPRGAVCGGHGDGDRRPLLLASGAGCGRTMPSSAMRWA